MQQVRDKLEIIFIANDDVCLLNGSDDSRRDVGLTARPNACYNDFALFHILFFLILCMYVFNS